MRPPHNRRYGGARSFRKRAQLGKNFRGVDSDDSDRIGLIPTEGVAKAVGIGIEKGKCTIRMRIEFRPFRNSIQLLTRSLTSP